MKTNWNEIARELNYCVKNYNSLTKQIVQTTNRAHAYGIDPEHEELIIGKYDKNGKMKMQGLKSLKGMAARRIEKSLLQFPLWVDWMQNVPGIGPAIGGQLVNLYYFKSIPVCKKCKADLVEFVCPICKSDSKGQGVLEFRVDLRTFSTISSWWHFMGRHIVDGKMPKRRKQESEEFTGNNWNSTGRKLGFDFKESINKQPLTNKYKEYAEKRKRYRENTHAEATKGHRHNMAWNESWKLFLSHMWQVAHTLDGVEMTKPWCVQHGGHDESSIIPPFYFNGDGEPE